MPEPLTERYRPRTLAEVYGQGYIVDQLSSFVDAPYPVGMLLTGRTGTGKTSCAMAIARDLGIDVEAGEWGGYFSIASGDQTIDVVRETIRKTRTTPMGSRHGWRVVIVNEADRMSKAVRYLWLDVMEDLPPRTVVIFTTNHASDFEDRFRDRLECYEFAHDGPTLIQDAQTLILKIWTAETGSADGAPKVDAIPGLVDKDGALSMRRVVTALTAPLRAWQAARAAAPVRVDAPAPVAPRGRHDLNGAPLPPVGPAPARRVALPTESYRLSMGDPQRIFPYEFWETRTARRA